MTFGNRILELRAHAGLSQEAFAERLDTTRQTVSRWELDLALPELEKIVRIARLFGVTTATPNATVNFKCKTGISPRWGVGFFGKNISIGAKSGFACFAGRQKIFPAPRNRFRKMAENVGIALDKVSAGKYNIVA